MGLVVALGAGLALAHRPGPAPGASDVTCVAMGFGPDLACCATDGWTYCRKRPKDAVTGQAGPFRSEDFEYGHAMRFAIGTHIEQSFMFGQGACFRLEDGSMRCSASLDSEHPGLFEVKGFDQGRTDAGFAYALPGAFEADGRGAPLCGLYDYDATCYVWTGKALEPRGRVHGPFHGIAVGASFACGFGADKPIRCWDVPPEGPASKARLLRGQQFAPPFLTGETVRALSFGGDQGCALLASGRVLCFHGLLATEAVEVKVPAAAWSLARSLEGGCVITEGRIAACFHDGSAPEAVPVANLAPLERGARLFVGQREACVAGNHSLSCFDLAKNAVELPPKPPEPPAVASVTPPKAPVEVAATTTPAQGNAQPEPEREWTSHLGLPFSFGHGVYKTAHRSDHGLWLALRAQALVGPEVEGRDRDRFAFAFGPYGEFSFHPVLGKKRLSLGAGLSFAWWFSEGFALVPSLGWYNQDYGSSTQSGLQAGLFLGVLQREWGPLSLPIGLRLDGRFGFGSQSERAVLFGGVADAALVVAIPVAFYLLATADWSFD